MRTIFLLSVRQCFYQKCTSQRINTYHTVNCPIVWAKLERAQFSGLLKHDLFTHFVILLHAVKMTKRYTTPPGQ